MKLISPDKKKSNTKPTKKKKKALNLLSEKLWHEEFKQGTEYTSSVCTLHTNRSAFSVPGEKYLCLVKLHTFQRLVKLIATHCWEKKMHL